MDDLKGRPEGGELCGQHFQVSCRLSRAAEPLRQLPSASACEILELSLFVILPALCYLSYCFWMCKDFGKRQSDQKARTPSSGAQSLCTLLI